MWRKKTVCRSGGSGFDGPVAPARGEQFKEMMTGMCNVLHDVFLLSQECGCLQCLTERGGDNQSFFSASVITLNIFFVCNRTARKPHRNAVGQDALDYASVKVLQQLLIEMVVLEDPQEMEALLYFFSQLLTSYVTMTDSLLSLVFS